MGKERERAAAKTWLEAHVKDEVENTEPEDRDTMNDLAVYLCLFMDGLEAGMRLAEVEAERG